MYYDVPVVWRLIAWAVVAIGAVLALWSLRSRISRKKELGFILVGIVMVFAGLINALCPREVIMPAEALPGTEMTVEVPIVAMKDNLVTEGEFSHLFFVGHGRIGGTITYFFYTENGNGGKILRTVDACNPNVFVYEQDLSESYVRCTYPYSYCQPRGYNPILAHSRINIPFYRLEFFVPRGSVYTGVEIDLG